MCVCCIKLDLSILITILASGSPRRHAASVCKKMSGGVVLCLERGADICMAQLMPLYHSLSLASVKSRLVLPFWYQLTRVVQEKGPLSGCVYLAK